MLRRVLTMEDAYNLIDRIGWRFDDYEIERKKEGNLEYVEIRFINR